MKVTVIAGGLSHERDVSERSGRRVADALRDCGHEVVVRDTNANLLRELEAHRPDVVVPMLHGAVGEDGTVREVLKALELPYVGSVPSACRLSFDKSLAKALLEESGVKSPFGIALPHTAFRELGADALMAAVVQKVGLPAVVKPVRSGSSLGATVVKDSSEVPSALVSAFAYADVALIERFVEGTEIAVAVLEDSTGPKALPAVEIRPDGGFYDYNARYVAGLTEFFCPARLDPATAARAAEVALTAHRELGLRDLSRADLIVDADGEVWFLETNVAPGFTETSLFPQAIAAAGLQVAEVFDKLVSIAAERGGKG